MVKGAKHSEATKRKMARSHTGVQFTDERKTNMKAAALRRQAKIRAALAAYEQRKA
jgi:hypothetical protein